jgi:hypothetical protein
MQSNFRRIASVGTAAVLMSLVGCGSGGPRTYAVRGKVELAPQQGALLAGAHVEAALTGDPRVRAWGVIQADGSFALESRFAGALRKGAPEGKYLVRILLADEDRTVHSRQQSAVAERFLFFETSGLELQVPAGGEVAFHLSGP